MFYGISVYMYGRDNKQHAMPHVHARYAGEFTVFDIETGDVIEGDMPDKQRQLVKAWILLRQEELLENWACAVAGETPYKILPL
jgi:hypothetical protein